MTNAEDRVTYDIDIPGVAEKPEIIAIIWKAVERASLEALKDKVAGKPRSLLKALAGPCHDFERKRRKK